MPKEIDLTGQSFGRWIVLERDFSNPGKGARWICQCSCDKHTVRSVTSQALRTGRSKSCGCLQKEIAASGKKEMSGKVFGRLKVLYQDSNKHPDEAYWICQCDCGTIKSVKASSLKNGSSLSCGCLSSSGEWVISNLLSQLKYQYQTQFSFDDLVGDKAPLRFDFVVFDDNKNIVALIEYQGEQHYINREFFDKKQTFEKRLEYDQKKRDYCKKKQIRLIEIPYWDFKKINKEYLINLLEEKSRPV